MPGRFRQKWKRTLIRAISKVFRAGGKLKPYRVAAHHYNLGTVLFQAMLDPRMSYTCGYWRDASDLNQAQEAKMDLICRKLPLDEGMRILDIGCGWGGFLRFAAEKYKIRGMGIALSPEQIRYAQDSCRGLPLEFRVQDFRDLAEKFDHVVSMGMMEHVCAPYYRSYMEAAHRCLKDGGLFLLHTVGGNLRGERVVWMRRYIFPAFELPVIQQVADASAGLFIIEDWHNFGADYDKTLMAWHENFERNWGRLRKSYDEVFHRMWRFYLLSAAAAFRSRANQLWQVVFSQGGVPGGYVSIR